MNFVKIVIVVFCVTSLRAVAHEIPEIKETFHYETIDTLPTTLHMEIKQPTGYEFDMVDLLGLGDHHQEGLKGQPSLKDSASKFLLEIYNDMSENEQELDHVREHLTRGRQRRALREENFITKFDRMEIEKCNNIITFSSKSKLIVV